VRGHEAVRVADPEKRERASGQLLDEVAAIHVITEEGITTDCPRGDVEEAVAQLASWLSRHGERLPRRPPRAGVEHTFDPKSSPIRDEGLSLVTDAARDWP